MIKVGFGVRCITPRVGQEVPGLFCRRVSTGVHDDLFARAVVVDDGSSCVALVQTDAIALPDRLVIEARRVARRRCGISGGHCLISATHTHSGGPLFGGFLSEPDESYVRFVADQVGGAISDAHGCRRAALWGYGSAEVPGVAFNRRFRMRDGTQQTHPGKLNRDILEAAGPADARVRVLGFGDAKDYRPFGCVVHFACHGTHMNGTSYSADYAKWIVDTLQGVYGREFGVVFLNGACGDVTQVDNQSGRPLELGAYWCERTGRSVGGAAAGALARMDYCGEGTVGARSVRATAGVRASTAAARKAARDLLKQREVSAEDVETIYARELLEVEKMRRASAVGRLEIMGVRIGDGLFWGVPGELFQSYAYEVEKGSGFRHTCCVELANGYSGYICGRDAFGGGGYEVRTARSSFLDVDAGDRVVSAAGRLTKRMLLEARSELEGLRRSWPEFVDDEVLAGIRQLGKK